MRKNLFLATICLCLCALGAVAADVGGQWLAQIPGRDGNTMETTFTFKVAGDQLTGSVENQYGERQISDGKVAGDEVSFTVKIEYNGNEMTFLYKGKVAGSEIRFVRERKGGEFGPAKVEFTAKKKG